jgi:oligoendopeptidase F
MLADFEDRVYRMSDKALTVENIRALYSQVAGEYGLGDMVDGRSYVNVTHLFTSPMYVISYVVSHDTAMQIYQMERAESGAGLKMLTDNLAPTEITFMAFAEATQLESPFAAGRIQSVEQTFREVFAG